MLLSKTLQLWCQRVQNVAMWKWSPQHVATLPMLRSPALPQPTRTCMKLVGTKSTPRCWGLRTKSTGLFILGFSLIKKHENHWKNKIMCSDSVLCSKAVTTTLLFFWCNSHKQGWKYLQLCSVTYRYLWISLVWKPFFKQQHKISLAFDCNVVQL